MATKITTGRPKGKPRGKPYKEGQCGNPGGKPKGATTRPDRKIEMDARLLARMHGPKAVEALVAIIDSKAKSVTAMAKIIAANSILDRGWGRPPVSVEVYEADMKPEQRAESAREFIAGKLNELEERSRAQGDSRRLN